MIRIVTYNIHSGRDLWWRKRLPQMAETLKALNPDVIGLQEVHQNSKYGYQASFLADSLGYHLAFSPSIPISDGEYGNALLTRLPCTPSTTATIHLPAKKEKRTLLQASLNWREKEIAVWVTHCSLNQTSRSVQLNLLTKLARQQSNLPLLLIGDFNASLISFQPILMDCAASQGKQQLPTLPAFRRRLDYIFASPHWHVKSYFTSNVPWSDHVPIIADLELLQSPIHTE
ncbi:endonuclease [Brevibacillus reuszeri]|uniref:Endonuclease n=1 Tax=Brevibacillus reuszeri TaxID=54915 RepID=A0ABQ0TY29_9BACL|nr:endonuclease/exonuclease/phosphatase family protein [Brevibacillus reuszeri]GED72793.1 endonuclease [Brevibacillus reuszeri]